MATLEQAVQQLVQLQQEATSQMAALRAQNENLNKRLEGKNVHLEGLHKRLEEKTVEIQKLQSRPSGSATAADEGATLVQK